MPDPVRILPDDEHNRTLVANVHPPDWVNPTPAVRYNLVVIGAGTAGLITAIGAAGLGARVALIERELMGGDCLNVGCVPSKALIRSARALSAVRDAGQFGVETPAGAKLNFAAVMERMRRLRASISPNDSAERYRAQGVDVFLGAGRFQGGDTIQVGDAVLRFKKTVIATGARAARPEISGLADVGYLTNETVFTLTELPQRLAVIGAGPIGCELAQAFARFGSQVTLLGSAPQILPREECDAAALVESALKRDGIDLRLGCRVFRAEQRGGDKVLHLEGNGARQELSTDAILVGAGRAPNVEGLNLEGVGVDYDLKAGVHVDDRLRTTNPRIFAAGDVCSQFQFTHAADAMARIVIQNSLFFGRAKASALVIPWCTYTDPEIAHVGLSESTARERGIPIDTFVQNFTHVDRAILDGETEGMVKIHVRRGSDTIAGATVVASHAGEMISEITLAITAGSGLRTLARTIHPYPTQAEAIKRAADAYNRTRLTPLVKSLFARWLAWGRGG
jgi:pyruvate/2-oxoglutarate dehydrogenase complex dihydrolipoamide dehydrogenase (E3) component